MSFPIGFWLLAAHGDKATLGVAIIGVFLGLFSVALTIYLNFIRKPKLRVKFWYVPQMRLPDPNWEPPRPTLMIENRGPGVIKLEAAKIRIRPAFWRLFGKETLQTIDTVYGHYVQQELAVTHCEHLVFYLDSDPGERAVRCLFDLNPLRVGVQDWWGRHHWAPKGHLEKAQQNYAQYKDFLAKARSE